MSRQGSAFARIREHEEALARRFLDGIAAISGVMLHGIAERFARDGVNVWDGNDYAPDPMTHVGLEGHGGGIRIGFLRDTTPEDVDRVMTALRRVAAP